MVRATWRGAVLAESDATIRLEGNDYFPPGSVDTGHLAPSESRSVCFWKGVARYHTVVVDGEKNPDAAWYYPRPSILARRIRDHVAFGGDVAVERD